MPARGKGLASTAQSGVEAQVKHREKFCHDHDTPTPALPCGIGAGIEYCCRGLHDLDDGLWPAARKAVVRMSRSLRNKGGSAAYLQTECGVSWSGKISSLCFT